MLRLPAAQPLTEPENLTVEEAEKRLAYWKKALNGLNSLHLHPDFAANPAAQFTGKQFSFPLEAAWVKELEQCFTGYSLEEILLSSLYALLYRYSGETDICLGITGQIPLRVLFTPYTSLPDMLSSVHAAIEAGSENQLSLDVLVQKALSVQTKASLTGGLPFKVMLTVNEKRETSLPLPYFGIHFNKDAVDQGAYQGMIEFNTDLFKEATIKRFIENWKSFLHYVSKHPTCGIVDVPLLLEEEKTLISQLNQTDRACTHLELAHDYFHQVAQAIPGQTALVFHGRDGQQQKMSYGELDLLTTQLANYMLRHVSKKTDEQPVVGVCVTRSLSLMIGIIAAFKTGLPLITLENTECHALRHKLGNHSFAHIMVDKHTRDLFDDQYQSLLNLDKLDRIRQEDATYQRALCGPEDLAYIMYTSGTTGHPKGVMVSHRGFSNLLNALINQQYRLGSRILSWAPPTFDTLLWDVLVAWAAQGEQHFCAEEQRNSPAVLNKIIQASNIHIGVFLPETLSKLDPESSLEDIISMGAMPHKPTLLKLLRPGRKVKNAYGPTETTIGMSMGEINIDDEVTFIGQPIDNMKIFILNPVNFSICPPGAIGEIYIAGPGVAKGYFKNRKLTHEKFPYMIFHPDTLSFTPVKEEGPVPQEAIRLYASGDYACYQVNAKGKLDTNLIGRKDKQLKIHGVRVELEGIEAILRHLRAIKGLAIVQNKNITGLSTHQEALTAYVVPKANDADADKMLEIIYQHLSSTSLPSVAYPLAVVLLPALPATTNGKLDVAALPAPDLSFPIAPAVTPCQQALQAIWADILECPKEAIGIHNRFALLGGSSIALMQLKFMIGEKFKLTEPLPRDILWPMITIAKIEKLLLSRTPRQTMTKITKYSQNTNILHRDPKKIGQVNRSVAQASTQVNTINKKTIT